MTTMAQGDNDNNRSTETSYEIVRNETYKVAFVAFLLLTTQLLLSLLFGFGGLRPAIILYLIATLGSDRIAYDTTSGFHFKLEAEGPPDQYWKRLGSNLGVMTMGMVIWRIIGIFYGMDKILDQSQEPDEILKEMTKNNFFLKILFAMVSHLTLFAFWRLWVNGWNGLVALYHQQ